MKDTHDVRPAAKKSVQNVWIEMRATPVFHHVKTAFQWHRLLVSTFRAQRVEDIRNRGDTTFGGPRERMFATGPRRSRHAEPPIDDYDAEPGESGDEDDPSKRVYKQIHPGGKIRW